MSDNSTKSESSHVHLARGTITREATPTSYRGGEGPSFSGNVCFKIGGGGSLNLRNPEEFNVNFARTNRLQKSSITAMQLILNK